MAATMETPVESDQLHQVGATVCLRMLGPLTIRRMGVTLDLPTSRKVRALISYLALAPEAVARRNLCELLWDVPDDPRGELRWCLSKVRRILDEPSGRRVESCGDTIRLDPSTCFIDAVEVSRAAQAGFETLPLERLRALSMLFGGDFLSGLEIDRHPHFQAWLIAQRRRFRSWHIALLGQLIRRSGEADDVFDYVAKWLELAPFDLRAHQILLNALARCGRFLEGEQHLEATGRLFEAEELESTSIRDLWRNARGEHNSGFLAAQATLSPALTLLNSGGDTGATVTSRRASIAVMPFVDRRNRGREQSRIADCLTHDVITRLAKLRSLFVIAQGSVFVLGERNIGPQEAGRLLNVDYVVSGLLRRHGKRLTVTAELMETRTNRIIWVEAYDDKLDNIFPVLDQICNNIVASIANEIETVERNQAILKPPNSLDAWEAYHRGLWHAYRFNKTDNDQAQHFFQMAVRLDPTFARAYVGVSFAHFQNAFHRWGKREHEMECAYETAGQSLIVDDRDPTSHWAMGRALWLRGHHEQSLRELDCAVELSPSFAHGHYMVAFVHAQTGNPDAAIGSSDHSQRLSPFDPLLVAVFGTRAIALVRLGRFEEAANWAVKAAARPNAFAHSRAVATCSLVLAGRLNEARAEAALIHKMFPQYGVEDLLSAFQFDSTCAALYRNGAKRVGFG